MARIYVAALDDARDRGDLDRSVANAIDRQLMIRSFSDATYPELIDIERRGHGFFAWGLPADPVQVGHWFRMQAGDWLLVGWRDCWRYCTRVLARYGNPRAAREIWGDPAPGHSLREHLFFLSEPVPLRLPYAGLADSLPESFGSFEPVDPERLAHIATAHGTLDLRASPAAQQVALVTPWRGPLTHNPSNTLLLRTDIHTLFDLGRRAVDTRSVTVVVADELMQTSCRILGGRPLRPSTEALDMHRRLAGL
jgi:hypothetical protein